MPVYAHDDQITRFTGQDKRDVWLVISIPDDAGMTQDRLVQCDFYTEDANDPVDGRVLVIACPMCEARRRLRSASVAGVKIPHLVWNETRLGRDGFIVPQRDRDSCEGIRIPLKSREFNVKLDEDVVFEGRRYSGAVIGVGVWSCPNCVAQNRQLDEAGIPESLVERRVLQITYVKAGHFRALPGCKIWAKERTG